MSTKDYLNIANALRDELNQLRSQFCTNDYNAKMQGFNCAVRALAQSFMNNYTNFNLDKFTDTIYGRPDDKNN
jgi:hypothetical protein